MIVLKAFGKTKKMFNKEKEEEDLRKGKEQTVETEKTIKTSSDTNVDVLKNWKLKTRMVTVKRSRTERDKYVDYLHSFDSPPPAEDLDFALNSSCFDDSLIIDIVEERNCQVYMEEEDEEEGEGEEEKKIVEQPNKRRKL